MEGGIATVMRTKQQQIVSQILDSLAALEEIEEVELFGSYANTPEKARDIDIQVRPKHGARLSAEKIKRLVRDVSGYTLTPYVLTSPGYLPIPPKLRATPPKYVHIWVRT